ncbi:MAG: hypothetical protein LJE70_14555 [Chromatiaceae bacterium]|jgi:hypothetical protein|nr:hypothetical protein [Chromatiaceae bacterium]
MSDPMDADKIAAVRRRRKIRLASLEADVAYFQARLEILGEPKTANQRAQSKAYNLLRKSLGDLVLRTKHRLLDEDPPSR